MLGVIFIVLITILGTSFLSISISKDRDGSFKFFNLWMSILMTFFAFNALLVVVRRVQTGLALTKIDPGTYKVGIVYQAGNNVSLGLEFLLPDKKEEKLVFYQFNKNAFDGEIKKNSKKLLVIETGDFKKLKLE